MGASSGGLAYNPGAPAGFLVCNTGASLGGLVGNTGASVGRSVSDAGASAGCPAANTGASAQGSATAKPAGIRFKITDVFKSSNAFRNALRDDLDDAVLAAGCQKCTLTQGGVQYVAFSRSVLDVAMRAFRGAGKVQLRRDDIEVGNRREHPMDGDAFKAHQEAVDAISDGHGFVLGVYVYSDATLLSWSGGRLCRNLGVWCDVSVLVCIGCVFFGATSIRERPGALVQVLTDWWRHELFCTRLLHYWLLKYDSPLLIPGAHSGR